MKLSKYVLMMFIVVACSINIEQNQNCRGKINEVEFKKLKDKLISKEFHCKSDTLLKTKFRIEHVYFDFNSNDWMVKINTFLNGTIYVGPFSEIIETNLFYVCTENMYSNINFRLWNNKDSLEYSWISDSPIIIKPNNDITLLNQKSKSEFIVN